MTTETIARELTTVQLAEAKLPANYQNARLALANTVEIDECKSWADKASALASYARQAKDDSLQKMAMRIKGRAVRRAGELLREIEPARGDASLFDGRDGTVPIVTRKSAAEAAGMSERQRKTAIAIGGIEAERFESLIEADDPPTITGLAEAARGDSRANVFSTDYVREQWGDAAADDPEAFKAATYIVGTIRDLVKEYRRSPHPARIVSAMTENEKGELRSLLSDLSPFITDTMQELY